MTQRIRDVPFGLPEAPDPEILVSVLEALPVGIAITQPCGRPVWSNPAADLSHAHGSDHERITKTVEVAGVALNVSTSFDVGKHKRLAAELFDRAYLDELTQLPNRTLLEQSAQELLAGRRKDDRFTLAFIDLDNFKHINDFYSHAAGDTVLRTVAERITRLLRPTDLLARVGGDEFVLLLTPIEDGMAAHRVLERISDRLKDPVFVDGYEVFLSASIGGAVFPDNGSDYDGLRRSADSAMYRVKSGVKGGVAMFDESMRQAATGRMAIEQRFRLALRDRRFCCAYQPKIDLRTHKVTGVEVLLRWRDEEGMIQAPGHFVALAIELGLINKITRLMLAEVVSSIAHIDATWGEGITISLNVAAKQAEDVGFMQSFLEELRATGHAHRFCLELTEEAFFARSGFQTTILPQLRAMGTKISIDDFGAGYSSLSALADIDADEIKIDRAFITDIHKRPRNQIVLKGIEALGRALGMTIVAEGIETFEELAWLQTSTRIDIGQGYYFSRPQLLADVDFRSVEQGGRPQTSSRSASDPRRLMLRAG